MDADHAHIYGLPITHKRARSVQRANSTLVSVTKKPCHLWIAEQFFKNWSFLTGNSVYG